MNKESRTVGFIGAGRTGTALAVGLSRAGYDVTAAVGRSFDSAQALAAKVSGCQALARASDVLSQCDVVFLTVPDDAIASTAAELPWRAGQGVVHCSGALPLEVLAPARERGALMGCLHPLQTFAGVKEDADRLAGSTFAVEGEGVLQEWLEEMVQRLGGRAIRLLPQDRPLYHASAVMACGYVSTLLDAAGGLWDAMGFSREVAMQALLPLARGTLANIESQGTVQGATGPIVRGDAGTVRGHLEALAERAPEALPLYCQVGLSMVTLALERRSIGQEEASELRRLLHSYLAVAENGTVSHKETKIASALDT